MVLGESYRLADKNQYKSLTPEHLFYALLSFNRIANVFIRLGIPANVIQAQLLKSIKSDKDNNSDKKSMPLPSADFQQVLFAAYDESYASHQDYVSVTELLLAVVKESAISQDILYGLNVDKQKLKNVVEWVRIRERLYRQYQQFRKAAWHRSKKGMDKAMTSVATPFMNSYSKDLTLFAKYGHLSTCVAREKEIEEIQAFAASLNAPHRLDDMLSPRLDGSKEPYRYRGERTAAVVPHAGLWRAKEDSLPCVALAKQGGQKSEIRREREFADCDLEDSRKTPAPERLFKCGAGVSQAAITPSGKLKMCVMIDYPKYDVLKSSLTYAWQKLRTRVKRIKPDKNYRCNKCELEPYCKWCPARGWLEDRKFTSCDLESRRWVKTRIQRLKNNEK